MLSISQDLFTLNDLGDLKWPQVKFSLAVLVHRGLQPRHKLSYQTHGYILISDACILVRRELWCPTQKTYTFQMACGEVSFHSSPRERLRESGCLVQKHKASWTWCSQVFSSPGTQNIQTSIWYKSKAAGLQDAFFSPHTYISTTTACNSCE